MATQDEMAVPERQLKQPTPPKAVSISAIMKNAVACEKHGNKMSVAVVNFRAVASKSAGVSVAGEVKLRFSGCPCQYWRPVK